MEQIMVYELLEKNRDFFVPNSKYTDLEIEEALINAPDGFENVMHSMKFYSPSTTDFLASFTIGGDRLYLRDFKGALLKIITLGGLFIWYSKDKKNAKQRCRTLNCEILFDKLRNHCK